VSLQPVMCDRCVDRLRPDDRVIQGIQRVDVSSFGDEARQTVDGPTAIVHERCWAPPRGRMVQGPGGTTA
jgi:hypothetical protein